MTVTRTMTEAAFLQLLLDDPDTRTVDRRANAAYIYLTEIEPGGVGKTVHVDNAPGFINLDFNARGRLLGIEVLDATRRLPYELLENAERI